MLIAIIFTYLSSQLLNLVLTIWEFTDIDSLRTLWCRRWEEDLFQIIFVINIKYRVYQYTADVVSILTILNGAVRLPIYYACNKALRDAVKTFCMCGRTGEQVRVENNPNTSNIANGTDLSTTNNNNLLFAQIVMKTRGVSTESGCRVVRAGAN
jgi:hypothetical protein